METSKKRLFNSALLGTVIALAWPTMLEQLMQTAVQYIDTAMVGSLGTSATAAVGSTTTIGWLVGSSISAFGVGFLAYISQRRGANEHDKARKASAQSVLAVLVVGLCFTAATLALSGLVPRWMQVDENIRGLASEYFFILYTPMLARTAMIIFGTVLRAAGDTKTPMWIGLIVNLINVALNFLLIYETRVISVFGLEFTMWGAGMGVIGAGLASAISVAFGGIAITAALFRHKEISPKGYSIKPDKSILKPCMRVAFPNMLQRFGTSLGYVAFAAMINSLGELSTAAHTVANTVESAFYIPGYGMMAAAATLTGNAIGAGDRRGLKELARVNITIEVILMTVTGGLLFIFAEPMAGVFSSDPQVIGLASVVLRMVAVSEPIFGVSLIIEGMMQGAGKTVAPFIFNIIGMWGVRILGTLICIKAFSMGLVSAWACMIGHNVLLFALFLAYYLRGRWNPLRDKSPDAGSRAPKKDD